VVFKNVAYLLINFMTSGGRLSCPFVSLWSGIKYVAFLTAALCVALPIYRQLGAVLLVVCLHLGPVMNSYITDFI